AIESVRCLDENVVTHPADADIGSVFGWGFPAWTGGTVSFIESVGLAAFVAAADELAAAHGERFAVPESLRRRADQGRLFYRQGAAGKSRHAA
ncbi:MAG TPA: hypothetical protein VFE85_03075, partial [Woeseiaceae bacterium]|nr:hypothetical protein [Woeseiaceae bacterium]